MASTLVKLYVHIIFHVKTTGMTMLDEDLPHIFSYMGGIIKNLEGIPLEIGGTCDHVHILSSIPKTMSVADFVRSIKNNSSKWIHARNVCYQRFEWQSGYGAFSVSSSQLEKTANYIRHQAVHHNKHTFMEEYKAFLNAYEIEYDEQYAFAD